MNGASIPPYRQCAHCKSFFRLVIAQQTGHTDNVLIGMKKSIGNAGKLFLLKIIHSLSGTDLRIGISKRSLIVDYGITVKLIPDFRVPMRAKQQIGLKFASRLV
jgi:hypothetical protein